MTIGRLLQTLPKRSFNLITQKSRKNTSADYAVTRKLAIIIPWLAAKENHVAKYREMYFDLGFDIMTVKLTIPQLLLPKLGSQVVAGGLLDYITDNGDYDRVVIHTMSVGAYLWGEVVSKSLRSSDDQAQRLAAKVAGLVLDSPVNYRSLTNGVSQAAFRSPVLRKALELFINAHLIVMHSVATKHYVQSSVTLHESPLPCPALMYFSESDEVEKPKTVRELARKWTDKGTPVFMKCFEKSKHVNHALVYKEEYVSVLNDFVRKLKL